jgi:serine-type D-Ala-D-Ala carboxypeptidase/endopeptidase
MTTISANTRLLPERVESAARERIAATTYQTLVFGMVDGDKSEVAAFGKLDDGKAPDGDTVYEIGSITKTFTATLLAQAVLAGRVTLDTPVAQLLPDFKIPSRSGKEMTLGQLAMQRSGLPGMPSNFLPTDPSNPFADYDAAKLKAFLAGYELPRDPGASYEYSNLGFGLLGHALAQSRHTSWGALTGEEILKPLGMTMSGTELTDAMRVHLAHGHDDTGTAVKNWDLDALAGAGALRSTANDMLRYLRANMGIDQSPLAAAMKLAQRARSNMAETAWRVGLAWMTTDRGIVYHGGGTAGYRSFLGFTEDGRRGVVILGNTAVVLFHDLGFAMLDSNAPLVPTYNAIVLPSASLDDYVGSYRLADKFLLTVFRLNGELFAQATGQVAFAIFPFAPNEFFAKGTGISLSFTRDPNGLVNGLVLHQDGDHEAPKLSASEDSSAASDDAMIDVLLLNDDHTPMEFVVEVLERIFDHDHESAGKIMLRVHHHGTGACGTYPWYIATAKAAQVLEFARAHQHPLRCVTAPAPVDFSSENVAGSLRGAAASGQVPPRR